MKFIVELVMAHDRPVIDCGEPIAVIVPPLGPPPVVAAACAAASQHLTSHDCPAAPAN